MTARSSLEETSGALGAAIWVFLGAVLVLNVGLYAAGFVALRLSVVLAFLSVAAVLISRGSWRKALVWGIAFAALLVASLQLADRFDDNTWDGQAYHKPGVIQLRRGWNPVRDAPLPLDNYAHLWVNHYAKGQWIVEASLYALTGRIEQAKAVGVLAVVGAFLLSVSAALSLGLSRHLALLGAAVLAFAPVTLYQLGTFYVDGLLGSASCALLALFVLALRPPDRLTWLALASTVVFAVNLKFTAVPYVACFGLTAVVVFWRLKPERLRTLVVIGGASAVLGVLAIGFNPYVRNTLSHGHPFYPVLGAGKVDLITSQLNPELQQTSRVRKLLVSTFARTSNNREDWPSTKWPWQIRRSELDEFSTPDVRLGGHGPWFGFALILAAVSLAMLLVKRERAAVGVGVVLLGLIGSALLNSEAWWARYAPQLWFIPGLVGVWAAASAGRWRRGVGWAVLIVLAVNVVLVGATSFKSSLRATRDLRSKIEKLRVAAGDRTVRVLLPPTAHLSNEARLAEAGLRFEVELVASPAREDCATVEVYPTAQICLP
jgi:hypothetical protein